MDLDIPELLQHVLIDLVQMQEFEQHPLVLARGDGARVWDVDGREYLDALSGVFVVNVGHGNRRVIEAMTRQLERLTFAAPTTATSDRMLELGGELTQLTPPELDVVKFQNGGSEAIEAAIKIARQYHRQTGAPDKFKVVSRHRSYHGATMGALAATGFAAFRAPFEPLPAGYVRVPPSSVDAIEAAIIEEGPDTVAVVILEPIMNMAGVRIPEPGYLEGVREICDRHDVLLAYDEIVTGFGRVGSWFAAEHFGVWPDLLCFGKGVTSGYSPLSGVVMTRRIADAFRGERKAMRHLMHGITYGGNPLSCAAGLAVIEEIKGRDLLQNAKEMGERLMAGLNDLMKDHPAITDVRGLGLLVAVDFSLPSEDLERLTEKIRELPMICIPPGPSGTMRFAPPIVIGAEDIDGILELTERGLVEARV
jgi:adenosylmethionine-8-amino-7-oxononanoate aminotransferase